MSINSPASTGMWLAVMSISVAKARRQVGNSGKHLLVVALIGVAIPHLHALARAGDDHVLLQAGVAHQRRRDHQPVGAVHLGVEGGVVEEALELARLRRGGVETLQRARRELLVG